MRRTRPLLATVALTLLAVSGLALVAGVGSATADSSVVGPGESIQKAINSADPGDTIVVRGVHHEDVAIRKDGIKLRGDDAVIEVPAGPKADSPCSRASGPEAICVLGDVNIQNGEVEITGPRVSDVSVSGFTITQKGDKWALGIDVTYARNTTVAGNRVIGMLGVGIGVAGSVNTTVAKNHLIGIPSPETDNDGIVVEESSRTTVVKNVVRSYPEGQNAIEAISGSLDTTIAGNDLIGNWLGVYVQNTTGTKILSNDITDSTLVGTLILDSTGTKIVSNDIRRSGDTGIAMFGPERANNDAKVVGNRISGGPWGIVVERAHGGSFTGNQVHDNCAGMWFEASASQPVGDFKVTGNTVKNNTRSCRAAQFGINFSGIGIALLGAREMEVTGNYISGNVPSGPTRISGGVVVSTDLYYGGTTKPKNNSVIGNHFGRNRPDIFYDKSGSGNSFVGNLCNTSVPTRLCN
jgi:parallel beta-helix repeat protein